MKGPGCANHFPLETCETKRVQESKSPRPHHSIPCPAHTLAQSWGSYSPLPLLRFVVLQSVIRVSVFILPRRSRICPSPVHPRATRFFVLQLQPNPTIPPYIFVKSVPLCKSSAASRSVTQSSRSSDCPRKRALHPPLPSHTGLETSQRS